MGERPHRKLIVWQKAIDLAKKIYETTKMFPREDRFEITSQLHRAVVSVASNIAEGAARKSRNEKIQFYYIARGSLSEIDTQLEICSKINLLNEIEKKILDQDLDEISRMLQGLINSREVL